MNIGDILFQLFAILIAISIPILFIVMIVSFVRSFKKQKEQLDRIEEKLDSASGQAPNNEKK
ncbi:DUF4083 domain-containing protein [Bacillus sp. V59.32b]|nr:DUF4083 domain-containing protein [Bacillus sp. V59.32b]